MRVALSVALLLVVAAFAGCIRNEEPLAATDADIEPFEWPEAPSNRPGAAVDPPPSDPPPSPPPEEPREEPPQEQPPSTPSNPTDSNASTNHDSHEQNPTHALVPVLFEGSLTPGGAYCGPPTGCTSLQSASATHRPDIANGTVTRIHLNLTWAAASMLTDELRLTVSRGTTTLAIIQGVSPLAYDASDFLWNAGEPLVLTVSAPRYGAGGATASAAGEQPFRLDGTLTVGAAPDGHASGDHGH